MRILIADDSEIVRQGVIGILSAEPGWAVCGEARDGSEAIEKARELSPDLILLDISMPGMNGLEIAGRLREEFPQTKIVIISQYDPQQMLPRVIEAGGHGCVDKAHLSTELLKGIRSVSGQM